jgi:hypothetical protein
MQAAKPRASKNSRLVIVSFVVMYVLYHSLATGQQFSATVTNCYN